MRHKRCPSACPHERKRGNAVLVSKDARRAIRETMCLLSVPGMRESFGEALNTPIEEFAEEFDW